MDNTAPVPAHIRNIIYRWAEIVWEASKHNPKRRDLSTEERFAIMDWLEVMTWDDVAPKEEAPC